MGLQCGGWDITVGDLYIVGAVLCLYHKKITSLYSRDFVISPVSKHVPYSRDFVVSPVSEHFPYSRDFVVSRHDYDVKMMMMMNVMPRSH